MDYKFTSGTPFVMSPASAAFDKELTDFIEICRVVKKMRRARLGCFGARTTAFKSVRWDETALERRGVDVETIDLSALFSRVRAMADQDPAALRWGERLKETMSFDGAPDYARTQLSKLAAALDGYVSGMALDAYAIRCWSELQDELKIAPCSVLGAFNGAGVPAACETDVTNAVMMLALSAAAGGPAGCLDLNNNYGGDPDKCILFHCGPLPVELMTAPGHIEEHKMFVKTQGENCSWGLNVGRIRPGKITIGGLRTDEGEARYFVEEAEITQDEVEAGFFGTAGVMRLSGLQEKLMHMGEEGFRHHAIIARGWHARAVCEGLSKYLGYTRVAL
jgi:L-fucose isomerase-like protein